MTINSGTITDQEIEEAFGDNQTSYTTTDHRRLLEQGVLKKQAGYRDSHTLTQMMLKLKLISKNGRVSKKGRLFLYESFKDTKF